MPTWGAQNPTRSADLKSEEFVRRFSAQLVDGGIIDELAARRAERAQKQSGERFDVVLSRLGLVPDTQLISQLGRYFDIPVCGSSRFPGVPLFPEKLDATFLKSNALLPVSLGPEGLIVAVADPVAHDAVAALSYLAGQQVRVELASRKDIERAVSRLYEQVPIAAAETAGTNAAETAHDEDVRQLAELGSEAPVIKLVNGLIARAAEMQASDIHVEPREDSLVIRFRIDGVLQTVERLPPTLRAAVSSRIKIMARLNIAEQRLPQDGRIKTTVGGRELDLRVSTMPTLRGESVVMRLLDRASIELDFRALGFTTSTREGLGQLLKEPNGIILVTGPTGSGKTTTLYAALEALNDPGHKIFTVEDPIEYQIAGINQIQVQPKIGLTFASALRSILRQDPDIILVGEMRDLETAEVAIQASLTGHLVLSTLHTNSAAATVTRLTEMGVETYLLASCLKGILAQRLVRRLCPACAAPLESGSAAGQKLLQLLETSGNGGADTSRMRSACGCASCRNTGYAGRTTISELMMVTEEVRRAILARSGEAELNEVAKAQGMRRMFDDGLSKVSDGETTLEEVMRAVRVE